MKMLRTLLIALLLALPFASALAEDAPPADVTAFFASEARSEYTIMDHVIIKNYCFVAARSGESTNTLFGFKATDDGWKYWMKNQNALPQGGYAIMIYDNTGGLHAVGSGKYTLPTLCIGRIEPVYGEYADWWLNYSLRNGAWKLEEIHDVNNNTRVLFDPDLLTYYGTPDGFKRIGAVRATVQRDLRYINISNIPLDYSDAKDKLTVAPSLPASAELRAQEIKFTGGRKYDVYSAPSVLSYHGANGKAAVSTNSWIQVFGTEDGWAMIQYSIDADHYRIGYIPEEALPASADVDALNFSPVPAWTSRAATLTDDPFFSNRGIINLPSLTDVQWLATIGSWAYVEVSSPQLMRGFVPANALFTDPEILHQALTTPVSPLMTTPTPGADK